MKILLRQKLDQLDWFPHDLHNLILEYVCCIGDFVCLSCMQMLSPPFCHLIVAPFGVQAKRLGVSNS